MSIANSIHGEVRFQGVKVAKVRSIDYQVQRALLETTSIGEMDDEYAYGKRSTSGSASLLYKTDDSATVALMNRIFDDGEQLDDLQMIIYRGTGKAISGPVLINSLGIASSVGDSTQISVSFVINGKPASAL
jgi:hypothetical protein